ncbi:MAG: diguanylate cyclase domain-containing protein [Alphaproteobacteria bacterium]
MKILLVSDDRIFPHVVANKLEHWGHRVTVEETGSGAYERIRKEPFRVVITGWDLEGMTGPELCRAIRKLNRRRYTYVVMCSSRSDKQDMLAALQAGADDYLTRPFNAFEFKMRLKAGKRLLNLEDELRSGVGTDLLTGLINKSSFRQFFRVTLAEARRTDSHGSLMFVRVENYDEVLAQFGLAPTQRMMQEISNIVADAIRQSDYCARMSNDEFCLALQNTSWEQCLRVAETVNARIENMSIHLGDVALRPQIIISVVNYPVDDLSSDEIIDSDLTERILKDS